MDAEIIDQFEGVLRLQGFEGLDLFLLGFIQLHFPGYQFALIQLEEIQVLFDMG
jgi:hypothetical protein